MKHLFTLWTSSCLFLLAHCSEDGGNSTLLTEEKSVCNEEQILCENECIFINFDPHNCGGCGVVCGLEEFCIDGQCQTPCLGGLVECQGVCSNTQNDRENCGTCGAVCSSGEVCDAGMCQLECGGTTPTLCDTSCVDTETDPLHCGDCDNDCIPGYVCNKGVCSIACTEGLTDCNGACVDLINNPLYCGDCDTECSQGDNMDSFCSNGLCHVNCRDSYGDCNNDISEVDGNGCETHLLNDLANCGACGNMCYINNGSASCHLGACSIDVCNANFDDCNLDARDGCEANLKDDLSHCGDCLTSCGPGEICLNWSCVHIYTETTITTSISASSDDAEENEVAGRYYLGRSYLDSSDLEMTDDTSYHGPQQIIGLRFTNMSIPDSAIVTDAYVEFVADESDTVTTNLILSGEASDNALTFTTTDFNITGRPRTVATAVWNNVSTWTAGLPYQTPSLRSIIQEIVDRPGWVSGNALVIIVQGTGTRVAESYDGDSASAATLHVSFIPYP